MKSFLFSTDNDRGGVILCDLETLEEAVAYLQERFPGVVRVEQGKDYWNPAEGYCFQSPTSSPLVDLVGASAEAADQSNHLPEQQAT